MVVDLIVFLSLSLSLLFLSSSLVMLFCATPGLPRITLYGLLLFNLWLTPSKLLFSLQFLHADCCHTNIFCLTKTLLTYLSTTLVVLPTSPSCMHSPRPHLNKNTGVAGGGSAFLFVRFASICFLFPTL
jgi:hypothetical protein